LRSARSNKTNAVVGSDVEIEKAAGDRQYVQQSMQPERTELTNAVARLAFLLHVTVVRLAAMSSLTAEHPGMLRASGWNPPRVEPRGLLDRLRFWVATAASSARSSSGTRISLSRFAST